MNQEERRKYLIQELLDEREEYCHIEIPQNESSQKLLLRDLMNVREPKKIKSEFYRIQDAYLQTENLSKKVFICGKEILQL